MSRKKFFEINIERLGIINHLDLLKSLIERVLDLKGVKLDDYVNIPFIEDLKGNMEDPVFHPEGTTIAHTQLVMGEVIKLFNNKEIGKDDAQILMLSALLHDIGKPETSVSSNGRISSRGHDMVGFQKSKYILDACGVDLDIKMKTLSLIKEHMVPFCFSKQNTSNKSYDKLSWRVNTRLLYYFSLCDHKGRKINNDDSIKDLEKFKETCIINNVWGETPIRYKRDSSLSAELLVGCAASGKSTYAESMKSYGYVTISSDGIREELCGDEADQALNDLVFSTLYRRIRESGKNMVKNIIIDATNYTNRRRILRVLRESGYNIKIVYFDTPYLTCLERNKGRGRLVPENVIKKQYELLVYPNYSEVDEINVIYEEDMVKMPSTSSLNIRKVNNVPFNMSLLYDGYNLDVENGVVNIKKNNQIIESINGLVDRNWLVHLPPTMSPCDSSNIEGYLEHPEDVFKYFINHGQNKIIYEYKYMGSRAIIILCRNKTIAKKYFNDDSKIGVIYSRRGREFFNDDKIINTMHNSLYDMMDYIGIEFMVLDAEIRPWNLKASGLIKSHYQKVGDSGKMVYNSLFKDLKSVNCNNDSLVSFKKLVKKCQKELELYNKAYQFYCWDKEDVKINPFHVLGVRYNNGELWNGFSVKHEDHISFINDYVVDNVKIFPVEYGEVDLLSEESKGQCVKDWEEYTNSGYEGFVFKPLKYVQYNSNEMIQPAVKCRGRDYLRIIYGIDYLDRLDKLRCRSTGKKRHNAIQEFKLGKRSLELFLEGSKTWEFHKYILGILAMETDQIDPRL